MKFETSFETFFILRKYGIAHCAYIIKNTIWLIKIAAKWCRLNNTGNVK